MPTDTADLLASLAAPPGDPRPVPRTLVLAAHPDDEVIGVGCRLPRLAGRVTIAHVTDGSPAGDGDVDGDARLRRIDYALARRRELSAALSLAGIDATATRELRFGDQKASHHLVPIAQAVRSLLADLRPAVLITHPYEGGHPDHDATAFAARAAVSLLRRDGAPAPLLVEMTSYHNGPAGLTSGVFLPDRGRPETTLALSPDEQDFKRRLFACFPTQAGTLQYFRTDVEALRPAPAYDFTRPPHPGTLFYEQYDWGMTGDQFRALAAVALVRLGLAAAS